MAHLLRIKRNGVYITPAYVIGYVPTTPDMSTVDFTSEIEDGGERPLVTRRNVTESIELMLKPVSGAMADAQTDIELLETWMLYAEEYQNSKAGYRVFLEFQPEGTTGVWQSEILSGKLMLESDAMPRWKLGKAVKVTLVITRRYYWEGEEVELALTNGAGSGTGGRTIYNHDDADAAHDNWVSIAGASVAGVLPAPIRLEITNTYNAASRDYNILIGQNLWGGDITHVLEGEATPPGGSDIVDATCSGGYYRALSVVPGPALTGRTWTLDSAMLTAYSGRYYRLIARMLNIAGSTTFVQAKLYFGVTVISETQELRLQSISATEGIYDLGSLQIPPWLSGEASYYPLDLKLFVRDTTTTFTLKLDCMFLMPTDNYRTLVPRGYGLAYPAYVVDDGILDRIYSDGWAPSGRVGHYVGYGPRVKVWPGKDTKIFVLSTASSGSAAIERTKSLRVYYRPRRLTV